MSSKLSLGLILCLALIAGFAPSAMADNTVPGDTVPALTLEAPAANLSVEVFSEDSGTLFEASEVGFCSGSSSPPPPYSCVCGSCCQCYQCWQGTSLALCRFDG